MTSVGAHIVGRQPELQAIRAFLEKRPSAAATLLLDGEAGVGKTTIWQAAVDEARRRGLTVLVARPADGEASLPFAALGDLVEPVLDAATAEVPAPQRQALDVALQRTFAVEPVSQLAVSRAVAEVLRTVGADGTLLVAVDDVQWLDAPSEHVLEFALRRLASSPVRILLARRSDRALPAPLGLERAPFEGTVSRVTVEPLSASELGTLLRERLDLHLPRPRLLELHRTCSGNPFYALEIGRLLLRLRQDQDRGPLPVPDSLGELLRLRLDALPDRARQAALLAAAST